MKEAPKRPSPISETVFLRIKKGDRITYLLAPPGRSKKRTGVNRDCE